MTYAEIIKKVADDTGLPESVVDRTYKAYWSFIRNKISELNLKDNLSEEEFNELRTNFNIPSLGKLCCTYNRYNQVKKRFKYIKNLKGEV